MRLLIATAVAALVPATWAMGLTPVTVTFQQNVNGYSGVTEIRISDLTVTERQNGVTTNTRDGSDGTISTDYLIDGFATDDPLTPATENDSREEQELIKFDSIFGAGAIPAGATILDAKLTYKTSGTEGSTAGTPPSPGPWGVAGLNQPFTTATRMADFPSSASPLQPYRGAWFEDINANTSEPYATRPVGAFGGLVAAGGNPATGTRIGGGVTDADVWPVVQSWSDGTSPNHGFAILAGHTGQTNGWGFHTSGSTIPENRPKLTVTYTESPLAKNTFQRDLNGYTGDVIARLDSGGDLNSASDDVTIDGSPLTGAYYIDGATSAGGILSALYKFNNVFGANAGQAPVDKPVAKAWLVLTTGLGDDHRSPGPISVHAVQRDWDTTTLYSNFGAVPGFQEADGDIGPVLDTNLGAPNGGESWFDVTSYLEAVRANPSSDKGLAVLPNSGDGWAVMMGAAEDASARPRLVVYSDLSTVAAGIAGDYNNNGVVDAADYVVWRNAGAADTLPNDPTSGTVDATDYATWKANFGKTPSGSGSLAGGTIPEPTSGVLGLIATMAVTIFSRKRSS